MGLFFDPTLNFTQPNVQQFIDNLAALKQDDVTEAPAQETTTYKVSETFTPYHAEIEEIRRELRRSQVRIMKNITKYPYKNSKINVFNRWKLETYTGAYSSFFGNGRIWREFNITILIKHLNYGMLIKNAIHGKSCSLKILNKH